MPINVLRPRKKKLGPEKTFEKRLKLIKKHLKPGGYARMKNPYSPNKKGSGFIITKKHRRFRPDRLRVVGRFEELSDNLHEFVNVRSLLRTVRAPALAALGGGLMTGAVVRSHRRRRRKRKAKERARNLATLRAVGAQYRVAKGAAGKRTEPWGKWQKFTSVTRSANDLTVLQDVKE